MQDVGESPKRRFKYCTERWKVIVWAQESIQAHVRVRDKVYYRRGNAPQRHSLLSKTENESREGREIWRREKDRSREKDNEKKTDPKCLGHSVCISFLISMNYRLKTLVTYFPLMVWVSIQYERYGYAMWKIWVRSEHGHVAWKHASNPQPLFHRLPMVFGCSVYFV